MFGKFFNKKGMKQDDMQDESYEEQSLEARVEAIYDADEMSGQYNGDSDMDYQCSMTRTEVRINGNSRNGHDAEHYQRNEYYQRKERQNINDRNYAQMLDNSSQQLRSITRVSGQVDSLAKKIEELSRDIRRLGTIAQNNSSQTRSNQELLDQLEELNSVMNSQEAIIKKQHDASLKYSDDVIYKTQKPLIMEMIGIADQIRMIMDCKREDESYDLMGALKELEDSVEASLSNNSVRRFKESENEDIHLNRRRQAVIGRETTVNPELDNHYRSVSPGYEWTMPYLVVNSEVKLKKILEENDQPQTFSFVIRPEEVVKLTYKPGKNEASEPTSLSDDTTPNESTINTEDKY